VRSLSAKSPLPSSAAQAAPALIGSGLALVVAQLCWPVFPGVSGMALIALGATTSTIARKATSSRAFIALHLFVYASLYLLFIGAICDAANRGPGEVSILQMVDFGASAAVMALVVRTCVAAIIGGEDAPAS
jgi:hypothetical protein